ncbi:DNA primase, partial [Burkholderia multivorans]|uniref:CHC2 zinc finger domain-containing protein n=1 Tax=Burkholderia multivorans TaxID=87883 RepID=UPI000DB61798
AGLIKREDIDELRSRTRLDEVVGEFVTLKTAGIGSLKGLCPFHDEKTPSFTVRPQVGMHHCFGCGESGDVFTFLQKVEQLSFVEAVEMLAGRIGMHLRYEDGKGPDREQASRRQRLLEM